MNDYRKLAGELIDYIATCNAHRCVPLEHDVNYYTARFHKAESDERGKPCGSTSSARYRA